MAPARGVWGSARRFVAGFVHAGRGIAVLFRGQVNSWVHLAAAIGVVVLGTVTGRSPGQWGMLVVAIGIVLGAEAFNTALEHLADEVSTDYRDRIRDAKDLGAAAVLVAALTAVALGLLAFEIV